MPLSMKIREAEVLMDGLTFVLKFDTKNDEGYIDAMPDYMPASGENLMVTLSNGAIAEPISIMSNDYNAWHAGYRTTASSPAGANLAPGQANHYWGAVVFTNPSGIEEMITPHMGSHGSSHPRMMQVNNSNMLQYYWQQPIPSGWAVNIYISASGSNVPTWNTLRMVASGITSFQHNGNFQLYGSGRYHVLFRSSGTEPLAPRILCWTAVFKLPHDKIVKYEQQVTLTIPSGYIRDKHLNINLGYTNYPVTNWSMVNASGFVVDTLGTHVSGTTVYFSPLYGNDANPGTDIALPKADFRVYVNALGPFGQSRRVVKCRRGEVHPISASINCRKGSYDSFKDPLIIEDYWHDYGGPDNVDPGTRPILSGLTQSSDLFSFTGAAGIDRTPNILLRGLHLFDAGFNILTSIHNFTISDCIVTNGTLGFNGEAAFNHGRINIHRCIIVDNARNDGGHIQGSFVHQTQRVLYSQNVFDKNGYVKTLPPITGSETVFSHTFYMQHGTKEAFILGNWISSGGGVSCQIRGGGAFCYNNIINCNFGPFILDETGYLSNNTILYSESLDGGAGGRGMEMQSRDYVEKKYVLMEKNLTANTILSGIGQTPFAFNLANSATGDSFDDRMSIRSEIRNNTFINNGEIGLNNNETSGNVYFHRNILVGGSQGTRPYGLYFMTGPYLPARFIINDNFIVSGSKNATPFWLSNLFQLFTFSQWQASGYDTRSIMTSAPTFSNSGANWGTYGEFCGLGSLGHRGFVDNVLRVRPRGVWGRQYDPAECSRFLRTAFMPTGIAFLNDSPSGFYGAMDYRFAALQASSGLTGSLIRYIKSLLNGGFWGY